MLTDEQRAERRSGIGGSDLGPILGVSPWATAYDVWLEKMGQAPPREVTRWQHWGSILESVVADEYARLHSVDLRRVNKTLRSKEYPWMIAHIDRQVLDGARILECKTARDRRSFGEPGSDDVPTTYYLQCLHYMIVTGRRHCDLAVLFLADRDLAVYTLEYREDYAAGIIEAERDFWRYVLDETPPPSQRPSDAARKHPFDNGLAIEATHEIAIAVELLNENAADRKTLDKERERLQSQVCDYMAEATRLEREDRIVATWRTQTRRQFDTKRFREEHPDLYSEYCIAADSRVFRLKPQREG